MAEQASTTVPDTPDQQWGSAAGLPSLVDTEATTTAEEGPVAKQDPARRKGGLLREGRHVAEAGPVAAAKAAASALSEYCSSYPAYSGANTYWVGSTVWYADGGGQKYVWTARVPVPRFAPPGTMYYEITPEGAGIQRPYWNRGSACLDDPPPAPVYYPTIEDAFPVDEMLVDSLTPLLVAHARGNNGGSTIRYTFKVCDNAELTGTNCFSSGALADNVGTWRVPAGKLVWGKEYWWQISALDPAVSLTTTSEGLSFTTGVRQPPITSQLASSGVDGQEFHQLPGNYTTTFTDASVNVAGPPLSVVRSYNSMDPRRDGVFGAGWSTRFDMKVLAEMVAAVPSVLVTFPDGRQVRFAAKGDGSYQPPPGMHVTLVQTFREVCTAGACAQEPSGWRMMDKSSTSYLFDFAGRLTSITDNLGRAQAFAYGADQKLASVTSPGGRVLSFTWNGAHVATVSTAPVNGQALTWSYSYQGDRLSQVCAPTAAPNCTAFTYTDGSLYRSSVLDSDPIGYWRLGEASGTRAADLGWAAGAATYSGATLNQPGALSGTGDAAISLAGGQRVTLPAHALARVEDAGSFETWFKTTKAGAILAVGNAADDKSAMVYVGTDGKLRGQLRRTGSGGTAGIAPITSAATVNDGQWHHVAMTTAGDTQRMYLDGQVAGTLAQATAKGWPAEAELGFRQVKGGEWPATPGAAGEVKSFGFEGQIDEVAVYAKPLTPEEVRLHVAARQAVPYKLATITLPSGRVWASNVYDQATDRLKTHTDANGGTWQIGAPEYTSSTGLSQVKLTDPDGNLQIFTYDAWRGYRMVSKADQLGKITKHTYDTGGYIRDVIDPNGNTFGFQWTSRGNLWGRGSCRSKTQIWCEWEWFGYHENNADPFDPLNDRMHTQMDQRSNGALDDTYARHWYYNQYGQVNDETWPNVVGDSWWGMHYAYTDGTETAVGGGTTPKGLLKRTRDPRGSEWTYAYTAAGDLAQESGPTGLKTTYTHDALGRISSQSQTSTAHPNGVTTTFTYDGAGRLLSQTGPGVRNEITNVTHTAQTRYTYDPDGRRLTSTAADLTGADPERTVSTTYDTQGRVATTTDPEGGLTKQEWSTRGALLKTTDPMGTVIENAYSKRGELTSRTLKNWTSSPVAPQPAKDVVVESYAYDPAGRLATTADAMGRKTSYTYFDDNLLSQTIADDAKLSGAATTRDVVLEANSYDLAGNLVKQVIGGGTATTEYVLDAASRLVSSTFDPAGLKRKTAYEYDLANHPIKVTNTAGTDPRAEITTYAYNAAGVLTRQTVENGDADLVTAWTVDDRGLTTAITDPRGNADGATAADYTTTNRYDALGRLIEIKAPSVQIDKAGTATQGRPTTRIGYNSAGWQTHVIDPEGRLSTAGFDRAGRQTSLTAMPYTPPGGTTLTPTMGYTYDPAGRLTTTTDPRGQVTTTEYDALGNPVRVTDPPAASGQPAGQWVSEYDLLGEPLAAIDPTGARTQATYDDLGRQITQTVIERRPASAAYTTTLTYNDAGYLTKEVRPDNKTTDFGLNAAGEVKTVTDPARDITSYDYDLAGRPAKVTDPLGNASVGDYDLAGRLTGLKRLDSTGATVRTVGLGYDPAGNQTRYASGEGHVTRRGYDATDLLTELIEPVSAGESITTRFGYDASGARTRLTDGRGNATWTGYNSLGLIETLTEPATTAHPNLTDRTWTHVYDAAGNETALLQPGGVRHDKQYDNLNRLTKISGSGAGIVAEDKTYGYDLADRPTTVSGQRLEYNDRSLLTKLIPPTGTATAFAYDAAGNPLQRIDAVGTTTYTWDADDRLKTVTDPVSGRTNTYGYDKADRLTTITSANPVNTQAFTYDALDRPETHTLKNSTGGQLSKITYGWDKDDNLTSKKTEGIAGAGTNTYGYDHAGRLTSWTGPDNTTTSYEWDAVGNRTKAGAKTYTYDERNRLTSGDGSTYTYTPRGTLATQTKNGTTRNLTFDAFDRLLNDGDATYTYDAFDRMATRQKSGGAQQRFAYAGLDNDIIAITDPAGTVQASYGRDPFGDLISVKEGAAPAAGALTDLHQDLIGTFTGTALSSTTTYNPYGEVTAQTGTKPALGYQSEYTDPDTGTVNMHARWYQPGTGTFASRDNWSLEPNPSARINRYGYGQASPLTHSDPSGHRPTDDPGCNWLPARGDRDVCNDAIGSVTSDDVCRDSSGRTNTCNPGKCVEFANACRNKEGNKAGSSNNDRGKGSAERNNDASSQSNSTSRPPASKPPAGKNPKDDPCADWCWVDSPDRPNCKTCFVDGNEPLDLWPIGLIFTGFGGLWFLTSTAASGLLTLGAGIIGLIGTPSIPSGPDAIEDPAPEPQGNPREDPKPVPDHIIHCDFGLKHTGECADGVANVKSPNKHSCDSDPGNSFVSGTRVLMADGGTKAIEEVKIGDQVVASDAETGRTEAKPVTALITGKGTKHLVKITIDTDGNHGIATDTITATDKHPFWVPELSRWLDAGQLQPFMWLQTSAGTYVQITAIRKWTAVQRVHNLTIDDLHTYHVIAGHRAVLVHNDNDDDEFIYRGIPEGHPFYQDALEGIATPRGGHADPAAHNGGNTDSIFTSWTTDLDGVARDAAEEMGYPGIVMRLPKSSVPSDRIVDSPDIYDESEILIAKKIGGADISIGGGPWRKPGC
jgi:RHS repeat-associated protein